MSLFPVLTGLALAQPLHLQCAQVSCRFRSSYPTSGNWRDTRGLRICSRTYSSSISQIWISASTYPASSSYFGSRQGGKDMLQGSSSQPGCCAAHPGGG